MTSFNRIATSLPRGRSVDATILMALAGAVRPSELAASHRERLRTLVLTRAREATPPGTVTVRAESGEWQEMLPNVLIKVLRTDASASNRTAMIRMLPGSQFTPPRHTQPEECLVLQGEIHVGNHRIRAGDMRIASPGCASLAIVSYTGALLMVRSEIPATAAQAAAN